MLVTHSGILHRLASPLQPSGNNGAGAGDGRRCRRTEIRTRVNESVAAQLTDIQEGIPPRKMSFRQLSGRQPNAPSKVERRIRRPTATMAGRENQSGGRSVVPYPVSPSGECFGQFTRALATVTLAAAGMSKRITPSPIGTDAMGNLGITLPYR